jgi:hypothetical protein
MLKSSMTADHGAFRALIQFNGDHLAVIVWDMSTTGPHGKVVGQEEHRPVDNWEGAKERAVTILAGVRAKRTIEEFDTFRRDLKWRQRD